MVQNANANLFGLVTFAKIRQAEGNIVSYKTTGNVPGPDPGFSVPVEYHTTGAGIIKHVTTSFISPTTPETAPKRNQGHSYSTLSDVPHFSLK